MPKATRPLSSFSRRRFLRTTALAGTALSLNPINSLPKTATAAGLVRRDNKGTSFSGKRPEDYRVVLQLSLIHI